MSWIKDVSLAPSGEMKIDWVERNMPVLRGIGADFLKEKPFQGLKITLSVHLEAKTAYLCRVLALGGAELTVFYWAEGFSMNAQSGAAKLIFGDCSALFTADITGDTQKYFLETLGAEFLKADVVKTPHHGITPMVSDFLNAVDPGYIWCTNYHGDRVEKTKNQATYRKIPIQFSGDGTIILECDGTDWYIKQTLYQF